MPRNSTSIQNTKDLNSNCLDKLKGLSEKSLHHIGWWLYWEKHGCIIGYRPEGVSKKSGIALIDKARLIKVAEGYLEWWAAQSASPSETIPTYEFLFDRKPKVKNE